MRQRVTCPDTCERHEIEYDNNPVDGTILGVRSCTASQREDTIMCKGACIDHLNAAFLRYIYEGRTFQKPIPCDDE